MSVVTAKLSFCVAATGPDLRLTACIDDTVIYAGYPTAESAQIEHEFSDSEELDHVLSFEMRGKLPEHTTIGVTGDILQDRFITITNVAFDNIELGHMFTQIAQYHHNHNDTTEPVTHKFYGVMGCNGRVEMRFTTPIYLWLLENM